MLLRSLPVLSKRAPIALVAAGWLALAGSGGAQIVITCPGQEPETFEHAWQAPCVETCADGSWVIRTDDELLPCQEANGEYRRRQQDEASAGGRVERGEAAASQPSLSRPVEADVCEEVRATMLATIGAGASVGVISKGASDLYFIVDIRGAGAHCKYLRYAFRTLKKPYEGKTVSPKDWDGAISMIINRREY